MPRTLGYVGNSTLHTHTVTRALGHVVCLLLVEDGVVILGEAADADHGVVLRPSGAATGDPDVLHDVRQDAVELSPSVVLHVLLGCRLPASLVGDAALAAASLALRARALCLAVALGATVETLTVSGLQLAVPEGALRSLLAASAVLDALAQLLTASATTRTAGI